MLQYANKRIQPSVCNNPSIVTLYELHSYNGKNPSIPSCIPAFISRNSPIITFKSYQTHNYWKWKEWARLILNSAGFIKIIKWSSNVSFRSSKYEWISCKHAKKQIWNNSSPPSAAYMRQWIGSALVQIMACRLIGTKPLSKPMLGYCQLDP